MDLVGPRVTTVGEKVMEVEGSVMGMEGTLGDKSTREEKMEEVGAWNGGRKRRRNIHWDRCFNDMGRRRSVLVRKS
ncbi:hypothetical protein KI387_011812, partial [Taxus chinensis]